MRQPLIAICRHAESIEDVDDSVYSLMKDLDIPLTGNGVRQGKKLAAELVRVLRGSRRARIYSSKGVRNMQTLALVLPRLTERFDVRTEIEPLIVKQDWGMITSENRPAIEAERYKVGVLRYAFPTGESAASLIRRLTAFRDKILAIQEREGDDIVVLANGFEFRVLLMLILGWSEEEFESYSNLGNCEYRVLTRKAGGSYALDRPLEKHGRPITRLLYEQAPCAKA